MTDQQENLRLTQACLVLFDYWEADHIAQVQLLGLEGQVPSRMMSRHQNAPIPFPEETMGRVSKLLRLGRTLEAMLPLNPVSAHAWINTPNRSYGGNAPINLIKEKGEVGIDILQANLDGTGGW